MSTLNFVHNGRTFGLREGELRPTVECYSLTLWLVLLGFFNTCPLPVFFSSSYLPSKVKRRIPLLPESHPTDPVLGGGSLRGGGGAGGGGRWGGDNQPEGCFEGEPMGATSRARATGLLLVF